MYYLVIFLSFLQSVFGFTLISSSVMLFKEPLKRRVSTGLAIMIIGIGILVYLLYTLGTTRVEKFAILFILFIELSWYLVCSADDIFVSIFSFLTFVNIYISVAYIGDILASFFSEDIFVIILILIRLCIFVILFPILYKFVRPGFRKIVNTLDKEWKLAILVPLMFLITQVVVLYYPKAYWNWTGNEWAGTIIVTVYFLFLAVYYLLYIQGSAIVEKYALEKRQLLVAQQEKLWESELERQKVISDLASQQRHDLHHHNAVVMDMVNKGENEKLTAYLKSFDKAIEARNSSFYCENPIANSIINYYMEQAKNENILVTVEADIPEKTGIDNIDLTCVLGNVLENALEGCQRLPKDLEKEIKVRIRHLDHRLRIRVENTCKADITFEGDLPVTSKKSGGTGIKSIIYTVESYDGTAGFSIMDGKFVAQIVMNEK